MKSGLLYLSELKPTPLEYKLTDIKLFYYRFMQRLISKALFYVS